MILVSALLMHRVPGIQHRGTFRAIYNLFSNLPLNLLSSKLALLQVYLINANKYCSCIRKSFRDTVHEERTLEAFTLTTSCKTFAAGIVKIDIQAF
jgi:hypothetical protein